MAKQPKTNLTRLIHEKGYSLVKRGITGNDLYFAMEPQTGLVCLLIANEGSKYFKELLLHDAVVDKLFTIVYKDYKSVEFVKVEEPTGTAQLFIDNEGFEILTQVKRKIDKIGVTMTNEYLIRNLAKSEGVVSLAHIAHVDNTLTNANIVNLTVEEVTVFLQHLVKVAKKLQEEIKGEEKENV